MELLALQNAWIFRPLGLQPGFKNSIRIPLHPAASIRCQQVQNWGKNRKSANNKIWKREKDTTDGSEIDVGMI